MVTQEWGEGSRGPRRGSADSESRDAEETRPRHDGPCVKMTGRLDRNSTSSSREHRVSVHAGHHCRSPPPDTARHTPIRHWLPSPGHSSVMGTRSCNLLTGEKTRSQCCGNLPGRPGPGPWPVTGAPAPAGASTYLQARPLGSPPLSCSCELCELAPGALDCRPTATG